LVATACVHSHASVLPAAAEARMSSVTESDEQDS